MIKFPHVRVKLQDGNAFAIIGAVTRGLRLAGYHADANEFSNVAMNCESYDELLQLAVTTVSVEV
jgi:hypothetical protein